MPLAELKISLLLTYDDILAYKILVTQTDGFGENRVMEAAMAVATAREVMVRGTTRGTARAVITRATAREATARGNMLRAVMARGGTVVTLRASRATDKATNRASRRRQQRRVQLLRLRTRLLREEQLPHLLRASSSMITVRTTTSRASRHSSRHGHACAHDVRVQQ
jgi:hypothetical protein